MRIIGLFRRCNELIDAETLPCLKSEIERIAGENKALRAGADNSVIRTMGARRAAHDISKVDNTDICTKKAETWTETRDINCGVNVPGQHVAGCTVACADSADNAKVSTQNAEICALTGDINCDVNITGQRPRTTSASSSCTESESSGQRMQKSAAGIQPSRSHRYFEQVPQSTIPRAIPFPAVNEAATSPLRAELDKLEALGRELQNAFGGNGACDMADQKQASYLECR